jgi:hypothetical protein
VDDQGRHHGAEVLSAVRLPCWHSLFTGSGKECRAAVIIVSQIAINDEIEMEMDGGNDEKARKNKGN